MTIRGNGKIKVSTLYVQFFGKSSCEQKSEGNQQIFLFTATVNPIFLKMTDSYLRIVCLDGISKHNVTLDKFPAVTAHTIVRFVSFLY